MTPRVLKTLGKGAHAKLARHKLTGTLVAIKIIKRKSFKHKSFVSLEQEVLSLKVLSHPPIVQLFQVVERRSNLVLVMEYMEGGDLLSYLQSTGACRRVKPGESSARFLSALHHCHTKGIVHRDLKPGNLLLDHQGNIKLTDFGLSMQFSDQLLTTYCGTQEYAAPEMYLHRPYHDPGADIWSLGVVLYQMVTASLPFLGKNFWELGEHIVSGNFYMPDYLSAQCQDLLSRMMVLDPQKRANMDTIIDHPWAKKSKGLLSLREHSHDHVDLAMIEHMVTLGFKWDQVHRAVAEQRYGYIMGIYLILCSTKQEEEEKKEQARIVMSGPEHKTSSVPVPELEYPKENKSPSVPVPELDEQEEHKIMSVPSLGLEVPREPKTTSKPVTQLEPREHESPSLPSAKLKDFREHENTSMLAPQLKDLNKHRTTSMPATHQDEPGAPLTTSVPVSQVQKPVESRTSMPALQIEDFGLQETTSVPSALLAFPGEFENTSLPTAQMEDPWEPGTTSERGLQLEDNREPDTTSETGPQLEDNGEPDATSETGPKLDDRGESETRSETSPPLADHGEPNTNSEPGGQLEDPGEPETTSVTVPHLDDHGEPKTTSETGPQLEYVDHEITPVPRPQPEFPPMHGVTSLPALQLQVPEEHKSISVPCPHLEDLQENMTTSSPASQLEGHVDTKIKTCSPVPQVPRMTQAPAPQHDWLHIFRSNTVTPESREQRAVAAASIVKPPSGLGELKQSSRMVPGEGTGAVQKRVQCAGKGCSSA
ncbi:PREDICTED: serine/threonine-protein kinase MARK2-like [Condylura cristata]|uniref:serine/threonine-protein kinase MARK2-like n=1 Tax=Condylura cristata TaxID=143302 RepID=UPI000642B784|nr:PREDICTED: serine/threonine-protein kinase MARK2-like [Condylura cristata]